MHLSLLHSMCMYASVLVSYMHTYIYNHIHAKYVPQKEAFTFPDPDHTKFHNLHSQLLGSSAETNFS